MNNKKSFTSHESFYCQWSGSAKEYFETIDQAVENAVSKFNRTTNMSDDSFAYWKKQTFIIGKELVITQELGIVTHSGILTNYLPVS